MTNNFDRISPLSASRVFEFAEAPLRHWSSLELPEVLEAYLDLPAESLGALSTGGLPEPVRQLLRRPLRQLLRDPSTDRHTLIHLKNRIKEGIGQDDFGMTKELATLLYYVCICVILQRFGTLETTLQPRQLRHGLHWVRDLDWAQTWMKELATFALDSMDSFDLAG